VARDEKPSNGWRTGEDPVQRRLRAVAVVVFLAVVTYLAVDRSRSVVDTLGTIALLLGSIMTLLGYEQVARRLLGAVRGKNDDGDES